jgi:NADPH-dependent 2,4-dienoyl-CoA reductase/sulfur reductase-like enzyme
MYSEVERVDFDVALIGAGAYGMPLAAHAKKLGKKAVHMAGVTQILFGIRGRRWEKPPLTDFFNDSWTRPLAEETPPGFESVDQGAYW